MWGWLVGTRLSQVRRSLRVGLAISIATLLFVIEVMFLTERLAFVQFLGVASASVGTNLGLRHWLTKRRQYPG
jgi:hypothetical protein